MSASLPFHERILPAPLDGGFRRAGHWVWCGSVIRGEDGQFHMFASMWPHDVPFKPNWLTNSTVVRAVADTAEGPYTFVDKVLPPRGPEHWDGCMTHNPTIHRCGDTYLLYYTGTTYSDPIPERGPAPEEQAREAHANQRIGLATAPSPEGPWTRADAPILQPRPGKWDGLITTNPAPCVLDDGRVLLLYKSVPRRGGVIMYGVAMAERYDAPYERLRDEPILWDDRDDISYEDAYVWFEDGRYHMIFNDMQGVLTGEHHAGGHGVSEDGIHWRMADPPKAYSRTIEWTDGTTTTQGSFERPQLLLQNGTPTHLFAATANGNGWWDDATETWSMVVPLRT